MFYSRTYQYKKLILFLFTIILPIFILSPLALSKYLLPEKIMLIAGKEEEFNFNIPVFASISSSPVSANIKINQKHITNTDSINLNESFTVLPESEGAVDVKLSLFGMVPIKKMTVSVIPEMEVIPCGMTVGVRINTDGIMVLGTGAVNSEEGEMVEPSKGFLKSGDLILAANGNQIDNKEFLTELVEVSSGNPVALTIKRGEELLDIAVDPVRSVEDGKYKLGIWVRDSTQGIGTITYYNPDSLKFGALGHGIMDVDTKQLMSIKDGNIMESTITSVKQGKKGSPGELIGHIEDRSLIGNIYSNTTYGIYGYMKEDKIRNISSEKVAIGLQNEVEEGPAYILSNVEGKSIEKYEIEIQSINRYSSDDSKGMVIKITDEKLLSKTNGIVQGMSGSPIIQNNKLVGAVTHVFVQDPSRGYGIFIENMLKQEENI